MAYNLTNLTNTTTIHNFALEVNRISDGWMGVFLFMSILIIFFVAWKKYEQDTTHLLFFGSIMGTFLSMLLVYAGYISAWWNVVMITAVFIAGMVWYLS